MKFSKLMLRQLDRKLSAWSEVRAFFQPRRGWVNCMRKALGMTMPQLAKKLGVVRSRVIKIQQAELSGSLAIHTLREVANALNCDLVYALVPRKPLPALLRERAEKIAKQRLSRISHSMTLENQTVDPPYQQEQLEEMVNALLSGPPKYLWEDSDEI